MLGQFEKAIEVGIQATIVDSLFGLGYFNLARTHVLKKELQQAKTLYLKTLEIDSSYAPSYFNLGDILLQENKIAESVACRKKGLIYVPNDIQD